jgi:hypothetical protein
VLDASVLHDQSGIVGKTRDPLLRYPGFLLNLVVLADFMRLSLLKAAHAALVSSA